MRNPETPARPRAYSYIRFSTPEQQKGHSLERQLEKARRYADEHGLVLDTELDLTDPGVSGYRLKNAKTGALAVFLRAVQDGHVPEGSYLLVENMDRITRANMYDAQGLFLQLLGAGITVVTLTNGEAYSRDSYNDNMSQSFVLAAELHRAHQESARKSQLVSDAKERKRKRLANGEPLTKPYTKQTPGYVRWNDASKRYELIPERARVIREIFEKADEGCGLDSIARALNTRGEPTWGTGKRKADHWRGSFVRKILSSKAPLGLFTPHKTTHDRDTGRRRDIPEEPVKLWEPVVDEELYWRVARKMNSAAPRGRNAGRPTVSLVAGIIKCAKCGSTVLRVGKGVSHGRGRENVYLVCSRAHARAKGCTYLAVRYRDVEEALRVNAKAIIQGAPRGKNTAALERQIEGAQSSVDVGEDLVREAAELAAEERTPATKELLRKREAELELWRARLRELRVQQNTLTTASVKARLKAVRDTLTAKPFDVAAANAALKAAVKHITMDPQEAELTIQWHHAEDPQEPIRFYSKHMRWDTDNTVNAAAK
jgi:DNA invertase Pin-like site-specific DNA recombinase